MEFDTTFISNILNAIAPLAVELGVTFAIAETVFQWFIRVAFGNKKTTL